MSAVRSNRFGGADKTKQCPVPFDVDVDIDVDIPHCDLLALYQFPRRR